MSLRTYLVVALALVFGVSSAMGITLLVHPHAATVEKAHIVVAAVDVERAVRLTEANLELKEIPKDMMPRGALTRIQDAVGRFAVVKVNKEDYILDQLLSKKGSTIPPGKRAIPIQNSNISSAVQPGDKVDIMVAVKERSGDIKAVTLFTMIDVMAVNGSPEARIDFKADGKEPQSVDVLLTQQQAEDLEKGKALGTIRLALRSAGDTYPARETRVDDLKGAVERVTVVIAAADVPRDVPLTEANLELKEMPKDMVPPGALFRIEDAVDRVAVVPVKKADYLLDQLLSKKGSNTAGAAIPKGMVAIAVQNTNVSGLVQPGDKVDIRLVMKDEKSGTFQTVTLFTMVPVQAVDGAVTPTIEKKTDGKEPANVNLLLTQQQAEDLETAMAMGKLRLALRSSGDMVPAKVTRIADLNGKKETPGSVVPAVGSADPTEPYAELPQIRTIHGTQRGLMILPTSDPGRKRIP